MNATAAQQRLITGDVLATPTDPDGASPTLATASATLVHAAGCEIGLWEAGPGTDVDVEVDEVFLVLRGSGTVGFDDGSTIALRPGALVRLRAGDRTTWTITDRLRKLYLTAEELA